MSQLQPGRYQPRTGMDPAKLGELAESIRAQGVIQPIVVREMGRNQYEIIAGERRWRASQQAGLSEIPAVVRVVDDHAVIAMALIENIQREDLNPLEEATALQRLIDEFDLTHAQAADAVGRSRAAVSTCCACWSCRRRSACWSKPARWRWATPALLTLAPQAAIALARQAAEHEWSVREVEHRVQQLTAGQVARARRPSRQGAPQADIATLERELSEPLGTRVNVLHGRGGKGRLVIHYSDLDALDGCWNACAARRSERTWPAGGRDPCAVHPMTILVTGAAGFIGAYVCRALRPRRGRGRPRQLQRLLRPATQARPGRRAVPGSRIAPLDLTDRDGLAALFDELRPRVIHLAAQASAPR